MKCYRQTRFFVVTADLECYGISMPMPLSVVVSSVMPVSSLFMLGCLICSDSNDAFTVAMVTNKQSVLRFPFPGVVKKPNVSLWLTTS